MPVHSPKTKRECTGIFMLSLIYNGIFSLRELFLCRTGSSAILLKPSGFLQQQFAWWMFPPFQHLRNEAPRRITAIARMVISHFSGHIKATIMPAAKATATVPFDLFLLPIIGHLISDIIIRRLRLNVNFIRLRCIKAKEKHRKNLRRPLQKGSPAFPGADFKIFVAED